LAGKAGFEGVIGVGNVDLNDRRQGAYGNWKSVSSPGTQIMSTLPDGKYGNLTGTSMATPMVAGIAALMISQNPGLRNADVRKKMMDSAKDLGTPGFDDQFGAGRINAAAVLSQLRLR
jgi:subtilisin family serine protease